MKKKPAPPAPQPAQIQAIERCIERGDFGGAGERLERLQKAFPDFKPLKRLAFEIAWKDGNVDEAAAAAWDWCEATPNSVRAFDALYGASAGRYPFLFRHAAGRLRALGERVDDDEILQRHGGKLDQADGLRVDLAQAFMGCARFAEARPLVETLDRPPAQNNFAQILFAEGEIERAAEVFAATLEKAPENFFALARLAALRLWLCGKSAAIEINERLQTLTPVDINALQLKMESALFFGQPERADAAWRAASELPWYGEQIERVPEIGKALRYLSAMAAWRLGEHFEAIRRLDDDDDDYDGDPDWGIRSKCRRAALTADTPDWKIREMAFWWPTGRITALFRKKMYRNDKEFFDGWGVPTPNADYLVAVSASGGESSREFAISALEYLADEGGEARENARRAMLELLRLPCGPDEVRSQLQTTMSEKGFFADGATVEVFTRGKIIEARPPAVAVRDDDETASDEAGLPPTMRRGR
ncbi:MAG: hypothetical protein LBS70_00895 [Candidatus Accumulibacter sp.]|jgi:tetratricopeptide (TPR) repeat protein|nr:hypothetical protein [Accumulibacter sp.]